MLKALPISRCGCRLPYPIRGAFSNIDRVFHLHLTIFRFKPKTRRYLSLIKSSTRLSHLAKLEIKSSGVTATKPIAVNRQPLPVVTSHHTYFSTRIHANQLVDSLARRDEAAVRFYWLWLAQSCSELRFILNSRSKIPSNRPRAFVNTFYRVSDQMLGQLEIRQPMHPKQ